MGFFSSLFKLVEFLQEIRELERKPHSRRAEFPPRFEPRSLRTCDGRVIPVVRRGTRELWEEKGWKLCSNGVLLGYYRGTRKAFKGRIENPFSHPSFYIFDPSIDVLRGRHGACFMERGKNVYWVHFSPSPDDVNAGILRIEHCLLEKGI